MRIDLFILSSSAIVSCLLRFARALDNNSINNWVLQVAGIAYFTLELLSNHDLCFCLL